MVKIGLIADIQFADREDKGFCRFRSSLDRLGQLVGLFNDEGVDLVVQLGDLVDGNGSDEEGLERTRRELDQVLAVLTDLDAPSEHVIGNHCLSLPRAELLERLGLHQARRAIEVQGQRILLLDSLEVSLFDKDLDPRAMAEAQAALARQPKSGAPWAVDWNGALGERQREWLKQELARSNPASLLLCHHPIYPSAARAQFLAWDHQDVLQLLDVEGSQPVTWASGHDHRGGRAVDGANLFLTLPGLVGAKQVCGLERIERGAIELFVPQH